MRNLFPGYYRPTEEEFSVLWRECIFSFDANVLLNLYKYSQTTRESFLKILSGLRDRIWLPHQAALEYQENRLKVIFDQYERYDDIPKQLKILLAQLRNKYPRHPSIVRFRQARLPKPHDLLVRCVAGEPFPFLDGSVFF